MCMYYSIQSSEKTYYIVHDLISQNTPPLRFVTDRLDKEME